MPRVSVPLTRSTLLETQRSLDFARQASDLLDRKKEILIAELGIVTPDAEQARDALVRSLSHAYDELAAARTDLGSDQVRRAALAAPDQPEIRVTERSIVGALVPVVECAVPDLHPRYSLAGTGAELDRATMAFAQLIRVACWAAQTEATIARLGREIRKTQRRMNALTDVVIPRHEEIIKEVREALEDSEREDFFRAKRLRRTRPSRGNERGAAHQCKPSA
jgi:V/A-type H+/Na+-transporting ATPase subunit D